MEALSLFGSEPPDARRIEGHGTPEATWQAWSALGRFPVRSAAALFPAQRRVVVIAPHPDDELLGCGGTLAALARDGRQIVVVGVTDGEASHPGSLRYSPRALAKTRCAERQAGLRTLGLDGDSQRLGLPDGGVAAAGSSLMRSLRTLLRPDDVVVVTWRLDGHPDHEAVGRAAANVAAERGCTIHEMPIWMWHWAGPEDQRIPWSRLVRVALDDDAHARKRAAIAAHESQLSPDGERAAILPDWALDRLDRPFEYFFADPRQP